MPPVLPVVLYNGRARWNAAIDIDALVPTLPDGLDRYQLRQGYLLIDEHLWALGPMRATMPSTPTVNKQRRAGAAHRFRDMPARVIATLQHADGPQDRRAARLQRQYAQGLILPPACPLQ